MSKTAPAKRLYIKTYGCQMNVYDSERMADVLAPLGYGLTDEAEDADLVVLDGDPAEDVRNFAKVAYTIRAWQGDFALPLKSSRGTRSQFGSTKFMW